MDGGCFRCVCTDDSGFKCSIALKKYSVASNREAQYAALDFTYSSNVSSYEVMFIINLWCEYVRINYA